MLGSCEVWGVKDHKRYLVFNIFLSGWDSVETGFKPVSTYEDSNVEYRTRNNECRRIIEYLIRCQSLNP